MVRPATKRPRLAGALRRAVEKKVPLLGAAVGDAGKIRGGPQQLPPDPPVPIAARPPRADRMPRRPEGVSGVVYPDVPAIEACGSHEPRPSKRLGLFFVRGGRRTVYPRAPDAMLI